VEKYSKAEEKKREMLKIKNEDTHKIGLGKKSINKEEKKKSGYQYWAHGTWLIKRFG
jgi:hypothetical protein